MEIRIQTSFPFSSIAAFAANAAPVLSVESVFNRKRVSTRAARLTAVHGCRARTAQNIFALGNSFKVVGVNAGSIPAQMINLKSSRDFPFKGFEYDSVRGKTFAVNHNPSVTVNQTTVPVPAFSRFRYPSQNPIMFFHAPVLPRTPYQVKDGESTK